MSEQTTTGAASGPPPGFHLLETSDDFQPAQVDTARVYIVENTAWCKRRGIPTLTWSDYKVRDKPLVIVGGGHSLNETKSQLLRLAKKSTVIAINDAHDWLIEQGVTPDLFAMQEIGEWPNEFLKHANDTTTYYLASMAHPTAFQRLADKKLVLFHSYGGIGEGELLRDLDPGHPIVCGGEAMAIRAINLGWVLGYTDFHMFGVDGCYRNDQPQSHVYLDRQRRRDRIWAYGREFIAPYYLARQAKDLARFVQNCGHMFTLTCHGDGLVQHTHRSVQPERYKPRVSHAEHFGMVDAHAMGKE